jgi:hypothetical protein
MRFECPFKEESASSKQQYRTNEDESSLSAAVSAMNYRVRSWKRSSSQAAIPLNEEASSLSAAASIIYTTGRD